MATRRGTYSGAQGRFTPAQLAAKHDLYRRTGDPKARADLVRAYEAFARSLAARYYGRRDSPEDLVQAAMIGLINAIDRYDPARGVHFTTFAWATISGELKRHLRDRTWGLRVPRRCQELYLEVGRAREELAHELGRAPSVAELAGGTGLSEPEVVEAAEVQQAYRLDSLDGPVGDDRGLVRQVGHDDGGFSEVDDRNLVRDLLHRLSPQDRAILKLRFGGDMTQSEIAERVGLSQMQVSRRLDQILSRLRVLAA
ncbi:MAG: SigB/SigF/SigG family RNA polymerase sigma factor [Actinomycetota bacterium]|nr:SigB/SigF/SigG family RNA polymerase sigma factor [Actinomycetota bacterium]